MYREIHIRCESRLTQRRPMSYRCHTILALSTAVWKVKADVVVVSLDVRVGSRTARPRRSPRHSLAGAINVTLMNLLMPPIGTPPPHEPGCLCLTISLNNTEL